MGKHNNNEFPHPDRDHYPTPPEVTGALLEHINVDGLAIWECAAGGGHMAKVLKAAGASRVYCTDIHRYDGFRLDALFDFVSEDKPKLRHSDWIITNPPGGPRNTLAEKFIEYGLQRLGSHGGLALLLPMDFDSAVTRPRFFKDCLEFYAKIVLNASLGSSVTTVFAKRPRKIMPGICGAAASVSAIPFFFTQQTNRTENDMKTHRVTVPMVPRERQAASDRR
jgi:hypothetical protein